MGPLSLKQRNGIDIGRRLSIEQGFEWAAVNDVYFKDVQTDIDPNRLESFDNQRCEKVRNLKNQHNISQGLHILSGVNVAEISPFCRDGVDQYP
jgi:hypothetical protein